MRGYAAAGLLPMHVRDAGVGQHTSGGRHRVLRRHERAQAATRYFSETGVATLPDAVRPWPATDLATRPPETAEMRGPAAGGNDKGNPLLQGGSQQSRLERRRGGGHGRRRHVAAVTGMLRLADRLHIMKAGSLRWNCHGQAIADAHAVRVEGMPGVQGMPGVKGTPPGWSSCGAIAGAGRVEEFLGGGRRRTRQQSLHRSLWATMGLRGLAAVATGDGEEDPLFQGGSRRPHLEC